MDLSSRLAAVRAAIEEAAGQAGRDAAELTTIVVTKFHPAQVVRELASLGVQDFGESRHQEAEAKIAELSDLEASWHFVGQLQTNKARHVRRYADAVHSVDRAPLVRALEGEVDLDVFIQIDLTGDPSRGGVAPDEVEALAEKVLIASGLRLRGLMAVAPLGGDPRAAFATVREASERLLRVAPEASALSMGMSGDFRAAILEGATHLRIGSAITGNRPAQG